MSDKPRCPECGQASPPCRECLRIGPPSCGSPDHFRHFGTDRNPCATCGDGPLALREKVAGILPPTIAVERSDAVCAIVRDHLTDPSTVNQLAEFLALRDGFGEHALAFAVGAMSKYTTDAEAILAALTRAITPEPTTDSKEVE